MAFTPTPHPVYEIPSREDMEKFAALGEPGLERLRLGLEKREELIRLEGEDPYRYGYEPPHWRDADTFWSDCSELLVQGGNRAGKSEYAAKRVVQKMVEKKRARVWVTGMTAQSSIRDQQQLVYKYIPVEWKHIKKTRTQNVSFSQKNGFTENTFILPNGSQCWFYNYTQEMRVVEGGEVDLIWADELIPLPWIETLRYRLVTRAGKLLVTFTPVNGYTPTVKEYLTGMRVRHARKSPLLPDTVNVPGVPRGTMPYMAEGRKPSQRVMWFFTDMNPYNPYEEMKKTLNGENTVQIKLRAYGYAENLAGKRFPKFSSTHILEESKIPSEGTNYMAVDPASSRNWFCLWLRVDPKGRKYIYREWPGLTDFGEWALPGEKHDGAPGPAQSVGAGRGLPEMKEILKSLEDEEIQERYIDPRAGASQAAGREGGTSIIDLLEEGDTPFIFEPSAGIRIENGIAIINDWLNYDLAEKITALNEPNLYISEKCGNLIYALESWTGADGEKGASKDPIDTLRYLAVMDPIYLEENALGTRGGGAY